jgi:hypothetical protein
MENTDYSHLCIQWNAVVSPPSDGLAYEGGPDMSKRNSNGTFLARMIAGLTLAMTIVMGSLGYALHNSQAFL